MLLIVWKEKDEKDLDERLFAVGSGFRDSASRTTFRRSL